MQINNKLRQALKSFRREFPQGTKLLSVKCDPVGKEYECFANALKYGGSQIMGWQFLVCSGVLVADHHAITEINGELVCVTPDPPLLDNERWKMEILMDGDRRVFLRDDSATVVVPPGFKIGVARPQKAFVMSPAKRQTALLSLIAKETANTLRCIPEYAS